LKHGGITNMMDRLNNPSKIEAYRLADELKDIMRPLFQKTYDIISGEFSKNMMIDWITMTLIY
jgi:ketol-acid reductoisomerase